MDSQSDRGQAMTENRQLPPSPGPDSGIGADPRPSIGPALAAQRRAGRAMIVASCIHEGLRNPRSRQHYDLLTCAEMILAQMDNAAAEAIEADRNSR
jgi:hypothetical protein